MLGGLVDYGVQGMKVAFLKIVVVAGIGGSLLIGDISDSDILGTDPTNQVIIQNGTIPDATSDGLIFIGAQDGSGDSKSSLSLYQEQDLSADTTEASFSDCIIITFNGVRTCIMTFAAP